MRLKGGRYLLDLSEHTNIFNGEDIIITLTDEQIKVILEKGISVKLLIFNDRHIIFDLDVYAVNSTTIYYYQLSDTHNNIQVSLKLSTKELSFKH